MDKNTIIGIVLIGLVLLGFSWLNKPNPVPTQSPKEVIDTLHTTAENTTVADTLKEKAIADTLSNDSLAVTNTPMYLQKGSDKVVTLQNKKVKVQLATLGGSLKSAQLLDYNSYGGKPLMLFNDNDFSFNLPLRTFDNKLLNTSELYFSPIQKSDSSLVMRLNIDTDSYLDFSYILMPDDYRLKFSISGHNLNKILPSNMTIQDLEWSQKIPQHEQSWKFENQYSSISYRFPGGNVEEFKAGEEKKKDVKESVRWVAFKDKYFSTVLISEKPMEDNKYTLKTLSEGSGYIKDCHVRSSFPFQVRSNDVANFTFFMGPNKYSLLKSYDKGVDVKDELNLDHLVYLGGSVFRLINQYMVIPVVNWLQNFISNWGIIILLLTILIKLFLSPFTYKSYLSQAKMRVLKPQVEEIGKKYPGKDQSTMMKKQQETMKLYKAAGASPMSGCLPMLLQMPFLIALYMYFPTSIELRGESFLWAKDLSTYDAVISWSGNIPLITKFMGNHISLFCLLMTLANLVYNKYMMTQNSSGQEAMPGMKWLPYIMSIMFFFVLNQNASGLSYYYFISLLFTIIQYFAFQYAINEEKLLIQLEKNKKKPQKKSKWMQRLEDAQKQQEAMKRQQNRK
ncbi:membrane protein insertase YidC [Porphyromonas pogonae]|uniref:membrane protein insertase YidC n=1 Tax=Porphyromonas pogonae TaxID=867595 RepID=UPI002E7A9916|nr:membrane protein insertase YidC [Porphyromonas pogonae]